MASHMEWHLPVQEEADWLWLFLFENEAGNIADSYTNAFNKPCPTPIKLGSAHPILIFKPRRMTSVKKKKKKKHGPV